MPTYRAYRVDRSRHIRAAQWIDADTDQAAREQAEELCAEGAPAVELWQATRLVDEIDCEKDAD
jgi:hypothetical protein